MRWSAYGHPAGFIPKMADYLNRCGVLPVDIALINGMGDAIQPDLVGMWVAIAAGTVRSGWQFRERRAVAELQPGVIRDGEVADPIALAEALKTLFADNELPKLVRLGIAHQRIVVRTLDLPTVVGDEKALTAAVREAAPDHTAKPTPSAETCAPNRGSATAAGLYTIR